MESTEMAQTMTRKTRKIKCGNGKSDIRPNRGEHSKMKDGELVDGQETNRKIGTKNGTNNETKDASKNGTKNKSKNGTKIGTKNKSKNGTKIGTKTRSKKRSKTASKSNEKKIILSNYYQVVVTKRKSVIAECKSCGTMVEDATEASRNLNSHIESQHADLFEKYKEEYRQHKLRTVKPTDMKSIDLRANYKRILFEKYFDLLSTKGKRMQALCRICNATLKFGICCSGLLSHLRTQHPNDYTNHQVAVKRGRYDDSDGNEIEIEFQEEFKRILFKYYYKVISKDEIKGLTAACRSCGRIQHSTQKGTLTFRTHLKECHPDVYKYYKEEVEETRRYQSDINEAKEIKLEFRSYAQQTLYDKHLRLIEINGKKARVICRHCELVLTGFLSNTSGFRKHLRTRHPKINEKFLKDIESYKSKNSGSVNIPGRKRSFSSDEKVEPKPKRKRKSNKPNDGDDEILSANVESEYSCANLVIDAIIEGALDGEGSDKVEEGDGVGKAEDVKKNNNDEDCNDESGNNVEGGDDSERAKDIERNNIHEDYGNVEEDDKSEEDVKGGTDSNVETDVNMSTNEIDASEPLNGNDQEPDSECQELESKIVIGETQYFCVEIHNKKEQVEGKLVEHCSGYSKDFDLVTTPENDDEDFIGAAEYIETTYVETEDIETEYIETEVIEEVESIGDIESPEFEPWDSSSTEMPDFPTSQYKNEPKCTVQASMIASAHDSTVQSSMIASVHDSTVPMNQSLIQISRNRIYGNIPSIKLHQRVNGGTFEIKDGEIVYTLDSEQIEVDTRHHLEMEHGKRHEKFPTAFESDKNDSTAIKEKYSDTVVEVVVSGSKKRTRPNDDTVESKPKRSRLMVEPQSQLRHSLTPDQEEMPLDYIRSEYTDATADLSVDEVVEEPIGVVESFNEAKETTEEPIGDFHCANEAIEQQIEFCSGNHSINQTCADMKNVTENASTFLIPAAVSFPSIYQSYSAAIQQNVQTDAYQPSSSPSYAFASTDAGGNQRYQRSEFANILHNCIDDLRQCETKLDQLSIIANSLRNARE